MRRAPGRAPEMASHTWTIGEIIAVISISSWCAPIALHTSGFSPYFSAHCIPKMACGRSVSSCGTFPISCKRPARFASFGLSPSSEAIIAQRLATSRECCSKFWPYELLYFIRPTVLISSGWRPWIPRSIAVRLPVWTISSSICLRVFATTSSTRAGWIRPSLTSLCMDKRAISRRTGSKQLKRMASGVSSTMISTPVAASMARIFLPSRPMILPLMSSFSMLKTLTAFSIALSVATRWMLWITIFFASCDAVRFASSIVFWICAWASSLALSLSAWIICSFASSSDIPVMDSSSAICLLRSFSTSLVRASKDSRFLEMVSLERSKSRCSRLKSWMLFLRRSSFSRKELWRCASCWSRLFTARSCSSLRFKNFSLASRMRSFFIWSASFLASVIIRAPFFLRALCHSVYPTPIPRASPTAAATIVITIS